jgi:hypothetical protein
MMRQITDLEMLADYDIKLFLLKLKDFCKMRNKQEGKRKEVHEIEGEIKFNRNRRRI